MKQFFTAVFTILLSQLATAQVVINEYSCSNLNGPVDAYNQREDWVELYNSGAAAVNISGYYLSDDKYAPQKWQIPAGVTVPAGGRRMVFCSDRDLVAPNGQLHPSFKLTQTRGEYFVIANNLGQIVDSVKLIPAQANHSRGRVTDGAASWGLFDTPTPNAPNANAKTNYATKPLFNITAGFYAATQNVTVSSPDPNVTIYYTIDGSTPTTTSTAYAGPIAVAVTTVVRAKAFSTNPLVLPSFTETNTYFINESISPSFSVVSVAGPYNTLFGSRQPIPNSIEIFGKNKQFRCELEGESRAHGNDSWQFPQKGFRVHARDQYGYDHAYKHKFFNTSSRDTFNVIILKAGASDNYPGNNPARPYCHMRDVFTQTLAEKYDLEMDGRKYEPAIVFVNGQYWGVYEIRERVDADYAEYYYGQTEKNVDLLSYWGGLNIRYGSDTGWVNLYNFIMSNNMSVQANYEHVTNYLNVRSLAEYFILNTWLVNSDWLNWNTMWWRGRKGQGVKWRYALWDEDNVLGLGENYTGLGTTTYQNNPCQPFSLFQNNSQIKHTDMLVRLMTNPTFEQLYRNTFLDMLNGPLNCDNMLPHFDSIVALIQPEMQRQITRWTNAQNNGSYANWQANVQFMRNQILGRCAVMADKLDSCMKLYPQKISFNVEPPNTGTIKLGTQTLSPYVWSRIIAADTVLNLTATPTKNYWFFDHWEKYNSVNSLNPNDTVDVVNFTFKKQDSVVAFFKYINLDSIFVTFNVTPPGKGTITLDNVVIPSYPYTVKLDRNFTYKLEAEPILNYRFFDWKKLYSTTSFLPFPTNEQVTLSFYESDTILANFIFAPPPPPSPAPPFGPTLADIDQGVMIPTAFTPNSDGKNDVFRIVGGKNLKTIELRIFDRWGAEIFYANSPSSSWDGTYKGQPAETGTYFYSLTAWFDNSYQHSSKTYKGEINLIR